MKFTGTLSDEIPGDAFGLQTHVHKVARHTKQGQDQTRRYLGSRNDDDDDDDNDDDDGNENGNDTDNHADVGADGNDDDGC